MEKYCQLTNHNLSGLSSALGLQSRNSTWQLCDPLKVIAKFVEGSMFVKTSFVNKDKYIIYVAQIKKYLIEIVLSFSLCFVNILQPIKNQEPYYYWLICQ